MSINSLQELLVSQLRDLYSAEAQIIATVPRAADATSNPSLSTTIRDHVEQTREQVAQLDRCFALMGETSEGEKCAGMEGLLKELSKSLKKVTDPAVLDAAIIADLQRVEHYEITAYRSAVAFAKLLGQNEIAQILEQAMEEEKSADIALSGIAETAVNAHALAAQSMAHAED